MDMHDCSYTSIYFKLFGIFSIQQKTNNGTSFVYSIRYFCFFLIAVEARGSRHVTMRGVTDWTVTRGLGLQIQKGSKQ